MRTSENLQRKLTEARDRTGQLQQRVAELDEVIDETRTRLGKAMALGDEDALVGAREALRNAEDELVGADRGLAYLDGETERLDAALSAARAAEAAADRDERVSEAVAAVDELAESLVDWLETFLPLADLATALTQSANESERNAAQLADEPIPSTGRARRVGWAKYAGLETVTAALRRYSVAPSSTA